MKKRNNRATAQAYAKSQHTFVTESECDIECGLMWRTDASGIIGDIKFLLKEYYVATFIDDGSLELQFNNGQRFKITVTECV